jgi:hypothetical protein
MGQRMKGGCEMTKPAFTPGPWTAEPNGGDDEDTTLRFVCSPNAPRASQVLAVVDRRGLDREEIEANARLIAAAPDMYEALTAARLFILREYSDAGSQALEGEVISKDARPVFSALCAALARAQA